MRHAPTLDLPSPPSLTSSPPDPGLRFRSAHAGIALAHLVQAMLALVVAGEVGIAVTHEVGTTDTAWVQAPVGVLIAVYFVAAVLNHGLSATVLRQAYAAELREGRNRIRWAEYAVSAPILMLLIALLTGVRAATALVVVGAATIVMVVCGWMQEALNPPGRRTTTMVPFWSGVVAALVPWSIVAAHMLRTQGEQEFGLSTFLALFLLWAGFGANQWLQYRQVGRWADYLYGEQTYLVLSLVAKSALAWIIVAGSSLT
jgi:hypothetical protein